MNELALFAGAGGGLLAAELLGHRVVCAVEKDPYCIEIILRRQEEGHLPPFPVWDDAATFDGTPWRDVVDVVSAGFPCQPFSAAGKGAGEADERNLWPHTIRIIREVEPQFVFLENVPRLLRFPYFGRILADLAESGFVGRYDCIPASAVGAPHLRDRLWIVAHRDGRFRERAKSTLRARRLASDGSGKVVANAMQRGRGQRGPGRPVREDKQCRAPASEILHAQRDGPQRHQPPGPASESVDGASRTGQPGPQAWPVEPGMGRVAYGVAHRVDRIRALGNGQVPRVATAAFRALSRKVKP